MISIETTLEIIRIVALYCSLDGPGTSIEFYDHDETYSQKEASAECFRKIWKCGHNVKDAGVIVFETSNCIDKQVHGKL